MVLEFFPIYLTKLNWELFYDHICVEVALVASQSLYLDGKWWKRFIFYAFIK